jgi:hypothetical protein
MDDIGAIPAEFALVLKKLTTILSSDEKAGSSEHLLFSLV